MCVMCVVCCVLQRWLWRGCIDASVPGHAMFPHNHTRLKTHTASFLGGVMRMSASMCLILMEMTGATNTLPFLMMVLVIAKGVGDRFNYRWVHVCAGCGWVGGCALSTLPFL